ncbi:lysoplasmalogenase [uncultured Vibrio sp.]|uniref:lysoplasmalogenase n=1 Tax=uncultured Vibrio sp. TaxID=114054 RepID=UPI002626BF6A|nr:lysoplasmalogenase [uncultured Vibrio sp.]
MWSWLAVSLSGIGAIAGTKHGHIGQALSYKVLTFVLLAIIALTQSVVADFTYWLVAGLVLFAVADALHTLTQKRPLHFVCLLVAQVCYSKAFWIQLSGEVVWWLFALLLAACVVAFFLLLPRLGQLVFPVVIMGIMLIQLVWASGEVWLLDPQLSHALGFVGCSVLLPSALAYALSCYRGSIKGAYCWVMGGYFLAHAIIVASLTL